MTEFVDVYNENLIKVSIEEKDEVHKNGKWHKTIHCWIFRREEQAHFILFQKRAKEKILFPGVYDISAAGHYKAGESIEDGIREIKEELGLVVNFEELLYLGLRFEINKYDSVLNKEFCEVFILEENKSIDEYTISRKEIDGLVQIKVEDGIALFSGRKNEITVYGMEWNEIEGEYRKSNILLSRDSFAKRMDYYYGKIFMIADLYFKGERNLYI